MSQASIIGLLSDLAISVALSSLKEKTDEKKLRNQVKQYLNSQDKFLDAMPLDGEIDYEGLVIYIMDHLLDDFSMCLLGKSRKIRLNAKNKIVSAASAHANARTSTSKNSITIFLETILQILRDFYQTGMPESFRSVVNDVADEIICVVEEKLSSKGSDISKRDQSRYYASSTSYPLVAGPGEENGNYISDLIKNIGDTESIFELVACCCDAIYDHITDEGLFLSNYIYTIDGEREIMDDDIKGLPINNPNTDILCDFSKAVQEELWNFLHEHFFVRYWKFKPCLIELVQAISLVSFLDPICNFATIPYSILCGIDAFLLKMLAESPQLYTRIGPLHDYSKYNTIVYPSCNCTIISESESKLQFRDKTYPERIHDQISSVRIILKKDLLPNTGIPIIKNIKPIHWPDDINGKYEKLSIAYIPYSIHRLFDFRYKIGSSFEIEYYKIEKEVLIERCEKLLSKAIESKPNIIVFPEYVVSVDMLDIIKKHLKRLYEDSPQKLDSLLFVIAGSTWQNGDNISYILDRWGRVLGKYYKYSRFVGKKKKVAGKIYEDTEALKSPGKECVLVDIEGIGRMLPSICRDIIDGEYTSTLAQLLQPTFVMVPAWSQSVASFKKRLDELANKCHISSFLFNSCGAPNLSPKRKNRFTFACIPYKDDTIVVGKSKHLESTAKCRTGCNEKGCVFVISADYSEEKVKNGEVVTWDQIRC